MRFSDKEIEVGVRDQVFTLSGSGSQRRHRSERPRWSWWDSAGG